MNNKLLKNLGKLFFGNIFSKIFTAVATLLVTRTLVPEIFGKYGLAVAFASIFGYLTDLGLNHTFIREVSKPDIKPESMAKTGLLLRTLASIVVCVLLMLTIAIMYNKSAEKQILIIIATLPSIFGIAWFGQLIAYYQSQEKMGKVALLRLGLSASIMCFVLFGILTKQNVYYFCTSFGASHLLIGIVSLFLLLKITRKEAYGKLSLLFNKLSWFALNGFLLIMIPQIGVILLGFTQNDTSVGFFNAAFRFPSLLYIVPSSIAATFYPQLFKAWYGDKKQIMPLLKEEARLSLFLTVGISIPFILFAKEIILIIYSTKYSLPTVFLLLKILILIIPMQGINYPLLDNLTVSGHQRKRTLLLLASWIMGTSTFLILSSKYGLIGAGIGTISTEFFLMILLNLNPERFKVFRYALKKNIAVLILWSGAIIASTVFNSLPINLIVIIVAFSYAALKFKKEIKNR